jgi:hypothetical protein
MAKKALVLFSGGKDSFLTACFCIEQGYEAHLLFCSNGCVAGLENVRHGAERLRKMYGGDRAVYEGVCSTAGVASSFRRKLYAMTCEELAGRYPGLNLAQMNCMTCQSSMWTASVAFCLAHGIGTIFAGYRRTDEFCTGSQLWTGTVSSFARLYDIETEFPAWDKDDWAEHGGHMRDMEMNRRGFVASVLEPKCMLGISSGRLSEEGERSCQRCFDDIVLPAFMHEVDRFLPVFRSMSLDDTGFV